MRAGATRDTASRRDDARHVRAVAVLVRRRGRRAGEVQAHDDAPVHDADGRIDAGR